MQIAVIGSGFIGGILGRALARAGHDVTFGSRHPDDRDVVRDTAARVAPIAEALSGAEVVVLVDALFQIWIALALEQGRGRRLAFRLLEG